MFLRCCRKTIFSLFEIYGQRRLAACPAGRAEPRLVTIDYRYDHHPGKPGCARSRFRNAWRSLRALRTSAAASRQNGERSRFWRDWSANPWKTLPEGLEYGSRGNQREFFFFTAKFAFVSVAQLDRASASGAEGYRFESCRGYSSPTRTYDKFFGIGKPRRYRTGTE